MNRLLCLLAATALTVGCADESATDTKDQSADSRNVATAYLGLTVMDCHAEATQCVKAGQRRFLSATVRCSAELSLCLADVAAQAAVQTVESAEDVLACGTPSVECVAQSRRLRDVVACEAAVESCVVDKVDDLTGIQLPTTSEVLEGAVDIVEDVATTGIEIAGDVVETGVTVVGEVAETGVEIVGEVAVTGVEVVGEVVETGVDVVGTTVETAGEVVEGTVQVAGDVVVGTVGAVGEVLDCNSAARACWRDSRDLFACHKSYSDCLLKK